MPANLPVLYTTINLAGATSSIDIGIPYIYYIYESAGGNLSGNYTIQASATPTVDTIINIKKKGNISLNGNTFSVFGVSLTEEQANKELSITAIYNFTSASWDVFIDIDTSQLPSIYEGVESTAVPTSGTTTLLPNIDRKWQVFTGSQTLVGNYTITGTGSQDGQEFWIIWNSTLDLNGNTLSIFGLTIPEGDAIGGNFIVVAKYNGSAWVAKFIDGHYAIWEEGAGTNSVKRIGSTSTAAGNNSINLSPQSGSTTAGDGAINIGNQGTASGNNALTQGFDTIASGTNSSAFGNLSEASGTGSVAKGYNTVAQGDYSEANNYQSTSVEDYSVAKGFMSRAKWLGSETMSAGNNANNINKPNQRVHAFLRKTTTNATLTELFVDGSALQVELTANSVMHVTGKVTGIQTAGSAGSVGDTKSWEFSCILTNISGSTSLKALDGEGSGVIYKGALRNIPNVHLSGTATAGAGSTITLDGAAPAVDGWFNNAYIIIVSGTGAGQRALIKGFVGSTLVATIDGTWSVNPDATSGYIIESGLGVATNTDNWVVFPDADSGNNAFKLDVQGEANKTISWHAVLEINEICY
jgi:hypothetical protein